MSHLIVPMRKGWEDPFLMSRELVGAKLSHPFVDPETEIPWFQEHNFEPSPWCAGRLVGQRSGRNSTSKSPLCISLFMRVLLVEFSLAVTLCQQLSLEIKLCIWRSVSIDDTWYLSCYLYTVVLYSVGRFHSQSLRVRVLISIHRQCHIRQLVGNVLDCLPLSFFCKMTHTNNASSTGTPCCPMRKVISFCWRKCC